MTALSETKRYQAYPEYKDSGVEWLENIPSHWETKPLKHLCSFNDDVLAENTKKDYELCYVDIGSVSATDGISRVETMTYGSAPSRARRLVRDGDVIVSTVRTYLEAIAPINNPPSNMVVSTGFAVIRPNNKLYKGYAAYCLRANGFIKEVVARSVGVSYPAINASELVGIAVPSLPIQEQTQIANFLDCETAKIDTLIEKQQQLIKLLKEKRQAVISHAVTKGLNPQAPMKDSGVEWCDYIPEHWRIGKLGYFARVGNGATPSRENQSFWNDGTIGWLNSSKVNDVIITEAEQFITPLALAQTSVQPVKANDLVIAITGEGQTRGRVAICQLEATINQHLASIRIYDDCLHHEFLFLWLSANYERIRFESTGAGSTKGAITCGDIKSYPIVIAPLSEQTEIINHIKLQNQHFSNLIAKADNQVQLLKERRTALISAAVTGKIDVRNWQAPSTSITKIPEGEV
ncbi:restriction endonuclease subunit S [Vibrio parahaemolyticus]|uniref:restriction endonuclease subunit S n=1 Tax=Vibrio parahaemolyticus TaxID=670 RepID=UPI001484FDAF|nr:restriction endonuclease subunit S [Vibrio parahaemolyticus]NNU10758.1 restriction endonuclease subunit S [Vibrio parahaemolyticus]QQE18343.1 restriction endonuclease subunit S [Vibrio parahaemolyticus]